MVSPNSKIEPDREPSAVRSTQGDYRRKPPTKEFHEITEQVDEKRYSDDEREEGMTANKKKSRSSSALGKGALKDQLLSPFDLARGARDASDEEASHDREEAFNALEPVKMKRTFDYENKREEVVAKGAIFGAIEQPDLSSVNPLSASPMSTFVSSVTPTQNSPSGAAAAHLPQSVQEIIDQIAKEVYILEQKGTRETIIPLKGKFEGANVIITEYSADPKVRNITIDNLTAQGQKLLDAHKTQLVDELAKKDIVVHIFMATTTIERHVHLEAEADGQQSGFTKDEQQQQPKEKRKNSNTA